MDVKALYIELTKLIKDVLSKEQVPKVISATVVSYASPNAVVKLVGSNVNITIKNFSGQTLTTNDIVECMVKNGDYSNMFIFAKRI